MARLMGGGNGWARLSMPGRGGGGFRVDWYGADGLQDALGGIADGLVWNDKGDLIPRKTAANREMRQAAKRIAKDVLVPEMQRTAASAPVPIARAMAATARAKSDRLIMVQVGGVNPKNLRGFKSGVGIKRAKGAATSSGRDATSRTYRTTLAWGSEFGPKGGRRKPTRGDNIPGGAVNHYRVARNERGYWALPAVENVMGRAQDLWEEALDAVVDRYVRLRPGGSRG